MILLEYIALTNVCKYVCGRPALFTVSIWKLNKLYGIDMLEYYTTVQKITPTANINSDKREKTNIPKKIFFPDPCYRSKPFYVNISQVPQT